MFGKWHLGAGQGRLPTDQGFEEWFGFETTDIIYWSANPGMPLTDVTTSAKQRKVSRRGTSSYMTRPRAGSLTGW
jgi:arylsulfatase